MDVKRLNKYAFTQFLANVILGGICFSLMIKDEFEINEMIPWIYFLGIYGLVITFFSKRKLWEFLISFVILIPIIIPIMYASIKGLLPGELILFDVLGVWYVHNKYSQIKKNKSVVALYEDEQKDQK